MGRVEAVSISREKGRKKTNVGNATLKKDFGIIGDAHAGTKNRQVSLLAAESIEKMKAKGLKVGPGDFAENITTRGINLLDLKIGAEIETDGGVVLEISQIGKECHARCEIYYQAGDCVMPKEGVFARVLKGGIVKPGDELRLVSEEVKMQNEASGQCREGAGQNTGKIKPRPKTYKVAVLTISDRCSEGHSEDKSGKIVQDLISGLPGEVVKYEIIPDEPEMIKEKIIYYCDKLKVDLVLTNGGTGFTSRDFTPEATKEVIERDVPGIPEAMRTECLRITKRAMLSRGVAGLRGKSLIVNLPGSTKGAKESMEAILEGLPHGLDMVAGRAH